MPRNNSHNKVSIPDIHVPVEYTRKYGDIIDATPRFYRAIAFQTHMATQAPALAIANLGSNAPLSGEAMSSFIHSYPLLGVAAVAAGYKINKFRLKREFENGDRVADAHFAIQEEIAGFDLIRGKDKKLYMYSGLFLEAGMRGNKLGEDGIRLAHQALVAKKHDIDIITIPDFDRLQSRLPRQKGEEFGTAQSGPLYPFRKHRITNPIVYETFKDRDDSIGRQLELSPDDALTLAAELQKDRVGPLLKHLKNPELTKLYEKMSEKPALESVFVTKLRGALTRQLGHNESPSKVYRQDLGEGRVDMLYQVTLDNQIMATERATYFENNTQRATVQTKAIRQFFGYKTDGELLYAVITRDQKRKAGQPPQQPELLLAASLLLMTGGGKELVDHSLDKKFPTPTAYKAWQPKDWTYVMLLSHRRKKESRYKTPLHRKLVAIASTLALTHFGGTFANGIDASHHNAATSIAYDIQDASETAARHVTNFPKVLSDFLQNEGPKPAPTSQPDNPYISSSRAHFGEFSPQQNRSIYSVTSLSGVSTEGYWHASSLDSLAIIEDSAYYPFTDAGITAFTRDPGTYSSPLTISSDEHEILTRHQPDIHVTQHMNGAISSSYYTLPVLRGFDIVGAQITDEAQPGSSAIPTIHKTPHGRNYILSPFTSDGPEEDWVQQYKQPRLDYWLKKLPPGASSSTFTEEMTFPVDDIQGLEVDKKFIANRVHAALGLPSDASDQEVFDRIHDKYYSLRPFQRENVAPITLGYGSSNTNEEVTEMTSRIAETFAEREALLCNLANIALILGTEANMNGVNLNLSQGYLETNGDGHLTFNESHMWTTSEGGRIHDATPTELAPGEKPLETGLSPSQAVPPKGSFSVEKLLIGAGAVAALALTSTAIDYWQRRRRIKALTMSTPVSSSEPENAVNLPSRPKKTLSADYITKALNEINRIMFSQDTTKRTNDRTIQTLEQDDPLSEHVIASIPSPRALRRIARKNGVDYDSIPADVQAAIKKLHREKRAIATYLRSADE